MFRVFICYVMLGCCAASCHKNFSAQSDSVLFCASDNKRLELEQDLHKKSRFTQKLFTEHKI